MEEVVREAIFGNVGTLISFRVGPTDAPYLAKEFMPTFEEDDLINLDKFQIYNKMAIDGVTSPPFSAQTLPPYTDKTNNQDLIREHTRKNFAKPRSQVEEWLDRWDKQASKSQNDIKEEKLEEKIIKGKQMYPIVGTDGRGWYIEKDGGDKPNSNDTKTKKKKDTSRPKSEQRKRKKDSGSADETKKALKVHLKGLTKQLNGSNSSKGNKENREENKQKKSSSKEKREKKNNKTDHNGNHVIEEGQKISLNGDS